MQRYEHGGDIYSNMNVTLDFSVNTNPFGMPESVKLALCSHVADCERYPDPHCRALTAALAAHHGVEENCVLCGSGAADLIFRVCACLKPRQVLIPAPTFSEYERSILLFGGKTREFPLSEQNGFMLTDRILEALSSDVDMLFLCNPNNPTGRLVQPQLLRRIADKCEENNIYLVLDECFIDFTDGESMAPFLTTHPHLLILRAFTKLYCLAGLRLGYMLCSDTALLSGIGRFGQTWGVSVPAQTAGLAALEKTGWVEQTQRLVRVERAFMGQALFDLGLYVLPSDTNFLLIKSKIPLYGPLLNRGILVRDCSNFSGLNEHYIRIGLKTRGKNETLLRAISEVLHG
jgi:threonine-phosphate decarboxylase